MQTRYKFVINFSLCFVLTLINLLTVSTAKASSILYVKSNGSGDCTSWAKACKLQTALTNSTSGDEIWVAAGTYKPTSGTDSTISFALKNGLAIYGGFSGSETLRAKRNPYVQVTILSGYLGTIDDNVYNSFNVVTANNVDNSTILDGFTIKNGQANASSPYNRGGGLNNNNSNLIINNVIFSNNYGVYGGGMYNGNNSSPTLTNVTFKNNFAGNGGGGMYNENNSNPTLLNVLFTDNFSYDKAGGMANISSSPDLYKVTFINSGSSGWAGAMYNESSSPIIDNVIFKNGQAAAGAGMFNYLSDVNISNTTFDSNSASDGGGIYNYYSDDIVITNSTFYSNRASRIVGSQDLGYGGAKYNVGDATNLLLTNVTIVGNYAGVRPAIANYINQGTINIRNSIIWGNVGFNSFQILSSNSIVTYSIVQQNLSNPGVYPGVGNSYLDPQLSPLSNNGGFTQTIAIAPDSPAIDTANDIFCPNTDQRTLVRPKGEHCDIGAYEYAGEVNKILPKVLSVTRVGNNPTNMPNISFIVNFNKQVDGVDISDFSLTTSDLIDTSITNVTGSGDTYVVSINTGVGAGTIRLDVNDDDTIVDYALAPLGGKGSGNGNFSKGQIYTIERNRVLSISRVNSSPTNSQIVEYMVTFSGNQTGVDISDFVLTTSGAISGATISNVTGSGNIYNVLVDTGINDGTIRLDVVDDDTIIDETSEPLGGSDVGNGDFTSGETYTIKRIASLMSPILQAPEKKALLNNNQPVFQWTKIIGAQTYEIQFADDADFSINANSIIGITATSYTTLSAFGDGTYYWRVRAYNLNDEVGKWSTSPRAFIIDTTVPPVPTLTSPFGATTKHVLTFIWQASTSADSYEFVYDSDTDCSSPIYSKITNKTSIRPPAIPDGTYYWCVRAKDSAGNWSSFSPSFQIIIGP